MGAKTIDLLPGGVADAQSDVARVALAEIADQIETLGRQVDKLEQPRPWTGAHTLEIEIHGPNLRRRGVANINDKPQCLS